MAGSIGSISINGVVSPTEGGTLNAGTNAYALKLVDGVVQIKNDAGYGQGVVHLVLNEGYALDHYHIYAVKNSASSNINENMVEGKEYVVAEAKALNGALYSSVTVTAYVVQSGPITERHYVVQKQYDGEKWVEYVPKEVKGENKGATLAWNTTTTIANIGGTDITVKLPSNPDTNTDTKTSSANSTSKLYLVGATSQSSSGQTTYSNSSVYATSGSLYATTMYEGSTSLANKYLGKTAKASSATSADSATKAAQDASGNVITTTYATKSELSSARSEIEAAQNVVTVGTTQPSNYKVGDIWYDTTE